MTDAQITRRYQELKKIDARCGQCQHLRPYRDGDDLGECKHEGMNCWTDDHACCYFKAGK